jgi:hypothetical protein
MNWSVGGARYISPLPHIPDVSTWETDTVDDSMVGRAVRGAMTTAGLARHPQRRALLVLPGDGGDGVGVLRG